MKALNIVADENIPLLEEFFAPIGKVTKLAGRKISPKDIQHADVLLVRSVTQVNAQLLEQSSVQFVGSCTIGTDHIDQTWLEQRGIAFSAAPGCNATSVVNYIFSVFRALSLRQQSRWQDYKVGIVGVGNVGSCLYEYLTKFGFNCLTCDPFRKNEKGFKHVEIDELIKTCNLISLHVPLTHDGAYPTYHLFDDQRIKNLNPMTLLINTGRGPVIDNQALKRQLLAGQKIKVVLDVWETEPKIDVKLLNLIDLGTPHIAGYSLEGKCMGTQMVYQALCKHFSFSNKKTMSLPKPALTELSFSKNVDSWQAINLAIKSVYDVSEDDRALRDLAKKTDDIGLAFDGLRKNYPVRRQFESLRVCIPEGLEEKTLLLEHLGFQVNPV